MDNTTENAKELAKCFDFWKKVPVIMEFDYNKFNSIVEGEPRSLILDILVEGIEEKHPITGKIRIRRALSATEIYDRLNGNEKKGIDGKLSDDQQIKRNNLYFHLDKLLDNGIIKEITRIETGRRSTTYFGRAAKIIIPNYKQKHIKKEDALLYHPDFKQLIRLINKDIDEKKLDYAIELASGKNDYSYTTALKQWIIEYEKYTYDLDLDLRKLFDLIGEILRFDEQTIHGLKMIGQWLHILELKDQEE